MEIERDLIHRILDALPAAGVEKYAELQVLAREPSGTLHGLLRVRHVSVRMYSADGRQVRP